MDVDMDRSGSGAFSLSVLYHCTVVLYRCGLINTIDHLLRSFIVMFYCVRGNVKHYYYNNNDSTASRRI